MKHKLFVSLLGVGLAFGASYQLSAQEAQEQTQEAEQVPQQQAPAQAVSDGGVEAVREAQEMQVPPPEKKFKNAKAVLNDLVKGKKWTTGWDKKKKRYIVIESATFTCADPASDKNFIFLREAAIKRAILQGKAKIIEFCNSKMDAIDMVHTPGTDLNKELEKDRASIETELVSEKEALAQLLEKTNKAEADTLRETTFANRLDDAMAAIIKKIDNEYNANSRNQKAQARLEELKKRFEVSKKRIEELERKAKARKGKLARKQVSGVTTFASMPLYGATGIFQTESWDGKNYQVAIALCWSNVLERAARAIVTGEDFKIKPKANGITLEEWLEKQNLATIVGPRQFIDKDGNRWFIGVCAAPYDDSLNEIKLERNKDLAEQFAKGVTAFSVWGDVESYKCAQMAVHTKEFGDSTINNVATSMEKKLTQTIQGKTIRGLQEIKSEEVENPISGKTIYVSVYAIDPASAATALEVEKINYATKIMDERHQTIERGREAANKAAVQAAKNRPEDFARGAQDQARHLGNELGKRRPAVRKGTNIIQDPAPVQRKSNARSTAGTFSGDADVDDDF